MTTLTAELVVQVPENVAEVMLADDGTETTFNLPIYLKHPDGADLTYYVKCPVRWERFS